MEDFSGLWFDCETVEGTTYAEQCACEKQCANFLVPFNTYSPEVLENFRVGRLVNADDEICLLRDKHTAYLLAGITAALPSGFVSLDASRPWICYWILHALYLLEKEPVDLYPRVIATLQAMSQPQPSFPLHSVLSCSPSDTDEKTDGRIGWYGGYGGGPQQMPHGAPTYAAVLALCTIGTSEALETINRKAIYHQFLSLKDASSGGFRIHMDGEVDSRGTYTILAIARLLNLLTPQLIEGVGQFLLSCQSYEGGFGGEPGNEAHGGYNFCALAGLLILGMANQCDIDSQERWLLQRQVKLEGGFQGRTNKLVDSCYSYWQGTALALVHVIRQGGSDVSDMEMYLLTHPPKQSELTETMGSSSSSANSSAQHTEVESDDIDTVTAGCQVNLITDVSGPLSFNQKALQRYILHCGQQMEGGLRDKPGKSRDYYHSCYSLSGLSVAQNFAYSSVLTGTDSNIGEFQEFLPHVYGDVSNIVAPTSIVFNIGLRKLNFALQYFSNCSVVHDELMMMTP